MPVLDPTVLIISSTLDYSCDYICNQLKKEGIVFFRLNRDQFDNFDIILNPFCPELIISNSNLSVHICGDKLKSVYFRAPTFIRENKHFDSIEDEISTSQWSAFLRNLTVFEDCLWVNSPYATYKSELKAYQLKKASEVGLKVPETIISNSPQAASDLIRSNQIAFKSIDTLYIDRNDTVGFLYTQFHNRSELSSKPRQIAPLTYQRPLIPKIDLRVTVIGEKVFPFSITPSKGKIDRDWRLEKNDLLYEQINIPKNLKSEILNLAKSLELRFCGVDLIKHHNEYYFIEANPTGEWGWLMKHTGTRLDIEIAKLLYQ